MARFVVPWPDAELAALEAFLLANAADLRLPADTTLTHAGKWCAQTIRGAELQYRRGIRANTEILIRDGE